MLTNMATSLPDIAFYLTVAGWGLIAYGGLIILGMPLARYITFTQTTVQELIQQMRNLGDVAPARDRNPTMDLRVVAIPPKLRPLGSQIFVEEY